MFNSFPLLKLSFDGFMSVYVQEDDKEEANVLLGNLEKGSLLKLR